MPKATIGIDIFDSLTTGMYDDSRFVFREYIQNSVDSIDNAIGEGLFEKGRDEIYVDIDEANKQITITDNGTGISWLKAYKVLTDIANSEKIIGENRGFRGIGRLGGIAYCKKMVFETSFKGEAKKSVITWNAEGLRGLITSRSKEIDAIDAVHLMAQYSEEEDKADSHYFIVRMEGVDNTRLLDVSNIREYLSMVAPIDIQSSFIYKSEIKKEQRSQNINIDNYNIYINGELIYKPYRADIYDDKKKVDEVKKIQFLYSTNDIGEPLYWGWYTITGNMQIIKSRNKARGIRIRKGNIQIGDEDLSRKYFINSGDQRFAFYYLGEIHVIHRDLIPNSRRDGFEENEMYEQFKKSLIDDCEKLKRNCTEMSKINSLINRIGQVDKIDIEIEKRQSGGYISKPEIEGLEKKRAEAKNDAEKANKELKAKIEKMPDDSPIKTVIIVPNAPVVNKTSSRTNETTIAAPDNNGKTFRTDQPQYSSFNKKEKRLIGRIYEAIAKWLPDVSLRDNLIDKIEEELIK